MTAHDPATRDAAQTPSVGARRFAAANRTRWVAALAGLGAVWWWLFQRQFLGDVSVAQGDTLLHSIPVRMHLARALREGHLPLWVPEVGCGYPLFAEGTSGTLHPLSWIVFGLLPERFGQDLALACAFLAIAWIVLALARTLGLVASAAFAAALVASTSPAVFWLTSNGSWTLALPWSIVTILAFEAWWRARTPLAALALALAWAALFLAPYPPLAHATALFAGGALALRLAWRPPRPGRALLTFAGTLALGAALASVQLVPLYEMLSQSPRTESIAVVSRLSARAFVAGLFSSHDPDHYAVYPTELGGLGTLLAVPVIALLPWLRGPVVWSYVGMIALCAGLSGGPGAPIYDALRGLVPGLSRLRFLEQFQLVAIAPAAIVLGLALEAARTARASRLRLAASGALLVLLAAFASPVVLARVPKESVWLAAAGALAALALATAVLARVRRRAWFPVLGACFVLAETLATKGDDLPFFPRSLSERPPVAELLLARQGGDASVRAVHLQNPTSHAVLVSVMSGRGHDPQHSARLQRALDAVLPLSNLRDGIALAESYDSLPLVRRLVIDRAVQAELRGLLPVAPGHRVIDRFRVRSVVVSGLLGANAVAPDLAALFTAPGGLVHVLDNPSAGPPFSVHPSVQRADSLEQAAAILASDRASIVVENDPIRGLPDPLDGLADLLPAFAAASAGPIEVETDSGGFVFFPISIYPGWSARIDGVSAPVFPAEILGMAVEIPAGRHALELVFEPRGLRIGLACSALAAVLVGLAVAVAGLALRKPRLRPASAVEA